MDRINPYSYGANYNASEQLLRNNMWENRQEIIIDKRKSIEDSISNRENKKRRDENIWTTSSASTSKQEDNLETNWHLQKQFSSDTNKNLPHTKCTFDGFEHFPHRFMSLMYQVELSALCLLRKNLFRNTQDAIFKTSKWGQFNNIIQCLNGGYFCIRVQYVDTYYVKKCINQKSLFGFGNFSIGTYMSEFANELLCYLDRETDIPKYLIFYTNCALDLTNDLKLREVDKPDSELLQLSRVDSKTNDDDLMKLLKINNCEFYRFVINAKTRKNLFQLAKFSSGLKKKVGRDVLHQEGIKQKFFERLIFAVNQPNVEELIHVVRSEVRRKNESFVAIRKEVMGQLIAEEEIDDVGLSGTIQNTIYSFELFKSCIHEMFLCENILEVRFDERCDTNNIAMNSRNSFLYLKPIELDVENSLDIQFAKWGKFFAISTLFSFFVQNFDQDLDYFVIFTNGSLPLVKDLIVEKELTQKLQFTQINALEEKYFMFRHSFIDVNNLYHLSHGETRRIIFDSLVQEDFSNSKFSHLSLDVVKEIFLDRIVFAVRQYGNEEIYKSLEKEIDSACRVPYDSKELHEIVLRYVKSHESGPMTKGVMIQLYNDLRNRKPSVEDIQSRYFQEEINFAERVIGIVDVAEFSQFVTFLTRGNGKVCLATLKRNGIDIFDMATILRGLTRNVEKIFLDLYNLWFDAQGNKTKMLKIFEGQGFHVKNMTGMLKKTGHRCVTTLCNLYNLWFDNDGNPTNYLRCLQIEGVNLNQISQILIGSQEKSVGKFKQLYEFWFQLDGSKTQSLKNLEKRGINLPIVCNVMCRAQHYPNLYNLWFFKNGQRTVCLEKLEELGISLNQICSVIKGPEGDPLVAFRLLYDLWFDGQGRKTIYLQRLEQERVKVPIVLEIFVESGCQIRKYFKKLYEQWFETNGEKTQYLRTLESTGKTLPVICRLLIGAGCQAAEKFRTLANSLNSADSPMDRLIHHLALKEEIRDFEYQQASSSYRPEDTVASFSQQGHEQSHSRSGNFDDCDYASEADFDNDDDDEGEEYLYQNKSFSKTQLKRKIVSLFNLFPAWKKAVRFKPKWKHVIKEVIPIVNNPQALNSFLETKLIKKKINRKEFDEIYSVSAQAPFTVQKLEYLLRAGKKLKLEKTANNTKKDKFAKIIFPNERSVHFKNLVNFLNQREGKWYLSVFWRNKIVPQHVAQVLKGCRSIDEVITGLRGLSTVWFDESGEESFYLETLNRKLNIRLLLVVLGESGIGAMEAFKNLYNLWFDAEGNETHYLTSFEENQVKPNDICFAFQDSGSAAPEVIKHFHDLCFEPNGRKSKYLTRFERENVSLIMLMRIFKNTGSKTSLVFQELYQLFFDPSGSKSNRLQKLENNGIKLKTIAEVLIRKGEKAPENFEILYNFVMNENHEKRDYIKNLEKEITVSEIFGIIKGYETDVKCFKELYDLWFDATGRKSRHLQIMEHNGVTLRCLAGILEGTGLYAYAVFNNVFSFFFDKTFKKTKQMVNLEQIIGLGEMLEIVIGASKNAYEVVKNLYNLWFDFRGKKSAHVLYLENNDVTLSEIARKLKGSGKWAVRRFKKILNSGVKKNMRREELLEQFDDQWEENFDSLWDEHWIEDY